MINCKVINYKSHFVVWDFAKNVINYMLKLLNKYNRVFDNALQLQRVFTAPFLTGERSKLKGFCFACHFR